MTKKTTEIVAQVVDLLTPLASEDRQRVVQASLMLLGETAPKARAEGGAAADEGVAEPVPSPVRTWMKQNGVVTEDVDQVFHRTAESVEVVAAEMPGRNASEKALNAYVLTGLARFLFDGATGFDDKAARALCVSSGCYDNTNHSKYLKNKGNELGGTKEKGWFLTAPGLKRGAALVKELAKAGAG